MVDPMVISSHSTYSLLSKSDVYPPFCVSSVSDTLMTPSQLLKICTCVCVCRSSVTRQNYLALCSVKTISMYIHISSQTRSLSVCTTATKLPSSLRLALAGHGPLVASASPLRRARPVTTSAVGRVIPGAGAYTKISLNQACAGSPAIERDAQRS